MANEEMIQKHLDNFLAKIAGETPVDDEPRDSTEFWLKQIAEQGGGGTEVIANPTLAGTEADLTGLEVDGTKYKVPAGAYIATKRNNTHISAESLAYITNNYLTTPCFIEYGSVLYRVEYKDNFGAFISSLVTKSNTIGFNTSATLEWIRIDNTGSIQSANVRAINVLANPSGTASNDLTKLEVNGVKYNIPTGTSAEANPTLAGTEADLTGLEVDGTKYKVRDGSTNGLGYLTTAPTAANTDGIKIVVLSSEPTTKYDGYLYLITEA